MPSPHRRDVPRLKAEVVARVRAGASLRAVGMAAGMPCVQTVRTWARADAGFGQALAIARTHAAADRDRYDEAAAAEFLARARAGETIRALLRAPGMPGRRTYQHWIATQAPFCEAVWMLRQRRNAAIGERGRARRRGWDPALGDRIIVGLHRGATLASVLAGDPALPSPPTLRRWRREQPQFDRVLRSLFAARRRRPTAARCTPELTEAIVDRIVEGGSFNSIGREPGMPSRQTMRRWLRARPAFAEAVAWACEHREDWYNDQIALIAESAAPGTAQETMRRMGPLKRQLVRLRHRPGAVHRRRGPPR